MDKRSKMSIFSWFIGGFIMPPVMWLFMNIYSELVSMDELMKLAQSPMLIIYVTGYISVITFILNNALNKITECYDSQSEENIRNVHVYLEYLPYFFIISEVVYCIIGPNTALLGKTFMDNQKYLLSWMFGVPIILAYSVPFFIFFMCNLEKWASVVPIGSRYFNIKKRFYIITLISASGIILMILLFVYTVLRQKPDISLSSFLTKMIVVGAISLCSLFVVIASFITTIYHHLSKTISLAELVARGDFTQRGIVDVRDEIGLALQSLNVICDKVGGSIGSALFVAEGVVNGAMTQSSATEEISAALTQISAMTKTSAENTIQTDTFMETIDNHTSTTKTQMSNLLMSMEDLSKNSSEIRKIIKSIDHVAFQINLLALNAAIEAARAGEAGSSFAVVADEVRSLSVRTSQLASQTRNIIEETATRIESEIVLIGQAENSFTQIAGQTSKAKVLVSTLSVAGREQMIAIEQIVESMHQVDNVIQKNVANADELAKTMSIFKLEDKSNGRVKWIE